MIQKITNEEFNIAYQDINNKKILNKASFKYLKWVNNNEMTQIKRIALWKALDGYKPEMGKKFSSYLYDMTRYECMNWITNDRKDKKKVCKEESIDNAGPLPVVPEINYSEFDDMLSVLPKKLAKIVKLRIVYNMSFEEIGKLNKFSHETARRKLKLAYSKLKNAHSTMLE